MSHTKATVLLAGLAIGLGGAANAQTSSMDHARAYAAENQGEAYSNASAQGAGGGPEFYGLLQFNYFFNIQSDGGEEDFADGFQINRARLGAKGNIDAIEYNFMADFIDGGGDFRLLDYYLDIPVPGYEEDATIRAGQFKLPFLYEKSVSPQHQLAADRSIVNSLFGQGRSQGLMLTYAGNPEDDYKVQAAFSDGFNTDNTSFVDPAEADYSIGGRFDYKVMGAWEDFDDFTALPGQERSLRAGAAVFYQQGGDTTSVGPMGNTTTLNRQITSVTADVQYEEDGISAFGAFVLQDSEGGDVLDDATDLAFMGQAGYRFDQNNEVFGRFTYILADSEMTSGADFEDIPVLTAGYNHYVFGDNSAKFTADVVIVFETINDTFFAPGDTRLALISDSDDPQVAIRTQFQIAY